MCVSTFSERPVIAKIGSPGVKTLNLVIFGFPGVAGVDDLSRPVTICQRSVDLQWANGAILPLKRCPSSAYLNFSSVRWLFAGLPGAGSCYGYCTLKDKQQGKLGQKI